MHALLLVVTRFRASHRLNALSRTWQYDSSVLAWGCQKLTGDPAGVGLSSDLSRPPDWAGDFGKGTGVLPATSTWGPCCCMGAITAFNLWHGG